MEGGGGGGGGEEEERRGETLTFMLEMKSISLHKKYDHE